MEVGCFPRTAIESSISTVDLVKVEKFSLTVYVPRAKSTYNRRVVCHVTQSNTRQMVCGHFTAKCARYMGGHTFPNLAMLVSLYALPWK